MLALAAPTRQLHEPGGAAHDAGWDAAPSQYDPCGQSAHTQPLGADAPVRLE